MAQEASTTNTVDDIELGSPSAIDGNTPQPPAARQPARRLQLRITDFLLESKEAVTRLKIYENGKGLAAKLAGVPKQLQNTVRLFDYSVRCHKCYGKEIRQGGQLCNGCSELLKLVCALDGSPVDERDEHMSQKRSGQLYNPTRPRVDIPRFHLVDFRTSPGLDLSNQSIAPVYLPGNRWLGNRAYNQPVMDNLHVRYEGLTGGRSCILQEKAFCEYSRWDFFGHLPGRLSLAHHVSCPGLIWTLPKENGTGIAILVFLQAIAAHSNAIFQYAEDMNKVLHDDLTLFGRDEQLWDDYVYLYLWVQLYSARIHDYYSEVCDQLTTQLNGADRIPTDIQVWIKSQMDTASQCSKRCQYRLELARHKLNSAHAQAATTESAGVTRLTMLAAVFLPASLASSLLAMTTRFKDLHLLLYDWIGTVLMLGFCGIAIYALIAGLSESIVWWRYVNRDKAWWYDNDRAYGPARVVIIAVLPSGILAVTFLIGMLWRVRNGGIAFAVGLGVYILAWIIYRRRYHGYRPLEKKE